MSETVLAGMSFTVTLTDAPQELVGDVTCGIRTNPGGVYVLAASDDAITETVHTPDDGSSNYTATRTLPEDTAPTDPTDAVAYQIVWQVPAQAEDVEDLIVLGVVAWSPTLAGLGRLLKARTVDGNGNYLGTFRNPADPTDPDSTDGTNPTANDALNVILNAVRDVTMAVGPELAASDDTTVQHALESLTEYRAAMLVELHYPEQTDGADSSYEKWKGLYAEQLKLLQDSTSQEPGDRKRVGSVRVLGPSRGSWLDWRNGVTWWNGRGRGFETPREPDWFDWAE